MDGCGCGCECERECDCMCVGVAHVRVLVDAVRSHLGGAWKFWAAWHHFLFRHVVVIGGVRVQTLSACVEVSSGRNLLRWHVKAIVYIHLRRVFAVVLGPTYICDSFTFYLV